MKRRARRLAAGLALAAVAFAPNDAYDSAARGARFIVGKQTASGAFFSETAAANGVAEALAAVVAAGTTGRPVEEALDYIDANGPVDASRGAYASRLIMGIVSAGGNPRTFGGFDYVARLKSFYQPSGTYDGGNLYSTALAALGILAAGEKLPEQAITYFRLNECPGGGFSWQNGCLASPNVDTTALVVSVFVGQGIPAGDASRSRARSFLLGAQNADGGFAEGAGQPTNSNSTGLALKALADTGESAASAPWRKPDGANPVDALVSLQDPSGGFKHKSTSKGANNYATVQAVWGLVAHAVSPSSSPALENALGEEPDSSSSGDPLAAGRQDPNSGDPQPSATRAEVTIGSEDDPPPKVRAQREEETAPPLLLAGAAVLLAGGLVFMTRPARRRMIP